MAKASSPRRLERVVLAMVARAPSAPGKSRLAGQLDRAMHEALRAALFDDTFAVLCQVPRTSRAIVFEPVEARDEIRRRTTGRVALVPQRVGDLGARLIGALEDLLTPGVDAVLFIGSDLPDLPVRFVQRAVAWLRLPGDRVVLGPAEDGGYYLIGLKGLHRELFSGIAWGTSTVLAETVHRARAAGLDVELLDPWSDVDVPADLLRLAERRGGAAARTRRWLEDFSAGPVSRAARGTPREAPDPSTAVSPAAPSGGATVRSSSASGRRTGGTPRTSRGGGETAGGPTRTGRARGSR